jgi:hypothetical protein
MSETVAYVMGIGAGRFTVKPRTDRKVRVCVQNLTGKVFEFLFCWIAEEGERYAGEQIWSAVSDPKYPSTGPAWLVRGDLELVEMVAPMKILSENLPCA